MTIALEPPPSFSMLVIEDREYVEKLMPEIFADMPITVAAAQDAETGLRLFQQHHPSLVILGLDLIASNGMDLLQQISALDPGVEIIVLSEEYSPTLALESIQKGAAELLLKPVEIEQLRNRVARSLGAAKQKRHTRKLDAQLLSSFTFQGMVGRSPRMLDLFNKISRIAPHFGTVLVSGPSGTGKELVARALHHLSPVRKGPFIVCNCAALPESLAESELFGFQKGTFTGAFQDTPGLFERADQGTIFLDEISEMSIAMQAKLLRVLQSHEIQRLGSARLRKLNFRVIAASNRDLCAEVAEGRFREDLFYRLSAAQVILPPLRQRMEDLPLLELHFLEKYSRQYGKKFSGISRRAQKVLAEHAWPGNVRELENVIAGACMMSEDALVDVAHLRNLRPQLDSAQEFKLMSLREAQRKHVNEVLQAVHGNKLKAAEILRISRSTLYSILSGEICDDAS
ncbi:MAG TPA: sigma-54 dependent transcriptional regulator [Terriglobales bacterium]|nr:sigma-54 dependent transcriptional regulator [Terriglobales bacterium]